MFVVFLVEPNCNESSKTAGKKRLHWAWYSVVDDDDDQMDRSKGRKSHNNNKTKLIQKNSFIKDNNHHG